MQFLKVTLVMVLVNRIVLDFNEATNNEDKTGCHARFQHLSGLRRDDDVSSSSGLRRDEAQASSGLRRNVILRDKSNKCSRQ